MGADCILRNSKGEWRLKSPGETSVNGASDNLVVRCDAANHDPGQASVVSTAKAEMFGNIIIGGVIGAVIDHASGAGYEYPSLVRVKMGDIVTVLPARNTTKSTFLHARPEDLPKRTDWAEIEDVNAVPTTGRGQESYRRFLTSRYPRAVAIGKGRLGWSSNSKDAVDEAIKRCEGEGKTPCGLYAIDNYVVWTEKTAESVGMVAKAGNLQSDNKQSPKTERLEGDNRSTTQPAPVGGRGSSMTNNTAKAIRHENSPLIPAATRWASIDSVDALPVSSQRGRQAYRAFLLQPLPRAFAIGPNGTWAFAAGRSDAISSALTKCQTSKELLTCRLYAVDDQVVWSDIFAADIQAATWVPQISTEPLAEAGALQDVDAVPFISDRGKESYRSFLSTRSPRAFALSASGGFGFSSGREDASERAMQYCQKYSPHPCRLYVVNDSVVWPAARIDN